MAEHPLTSLTGKDHITAEDVLAVRAAVFPDMIVSREEAEAIIAVNEGATSTSPEWRAFFVEALTDHVVRQREPRGYVDDASAAWLIDRVGRVGRDGRVADDTELELLVHILEEAEQAPRFLASAVVDEVAVRALAPERRDGDGPTLTAEEVALLRRALYAFAGTGGGAAISREEAAVLFVLNDAARGRPNDPSWRDLFVHAIGSCFLAAEGYHAPSAEEAARLQAWLEAPAEGVGAFFARALRGGASEDKDPFATRNAAQALAARAAAPLDHAEAAWLTAQIGKDGALDDNEIALLRFLAREAASVDPALQSLIDQAGVERGLSAVG